MTVIAWDGKTLAADKRATCAGMPSTCTKVRRLDGGDYCPDRLVAWTGQQDVGELLCQWFVSGEDPAKWPEIQKDKDAWSRLIIVDSSGVWYYETQPVRIRVEDPFMAWGSGRDFAMAAMHLGKSAREAVEVACVFDTGCGNGVDAVSLDGP